MANCPSLSSCPYFQGAIPNMPLTMEYLKSNYCTGQYVNCARFKVGKALGKEHVPLDLFPEDFPRAARIIENGK